MDDRTTVADLKRWVLAFSQERDWEQFHHPKDLGLALACEIGELLEHFRYREHDAIRAALAHASFKRDLAHELADCLWLLLRLADVCEIDLASSLREKIELAAQKYPVDQCFGRPDKYTRYQTAAEDRAAEGASPLRDE
jgi:dCTP diphosphatase